MLLYITATLIVFYVAMAGVCVGKAVVAGAWSQRNGQVLFAAFCVIGAVLMYLLIAPLFI